MEKKTIGKFIAALRQSKGMTQKELGDMLYVSNRTVSRWERDECTPDLYLIPTIADIFGISADELLRGEHSGVASPAVREEQTERRFESLMKGKSDRLRNMSFIPLGLVLAGIIGAIICAVVTAVYINDRGYHTEISWLGFVIALFFCTGGIIAEVCFAMNAFTARNEQFGRFIPRTAEYNGRMLSLASAVIFTGIAAIFFCLPLLVADSRVLTADPLAWPAYGLAIAELAVVAAYFAYIKTVRKKLTEKGLLIPSEGRAECEKKENRVLLIITIICTSVFAALSALNIFLPELVSHSGNNYASTSMRALWHIMMIADAAAGAAAYTVKRLSAKK